MVTIGMFPGVMFGIELYSDADEDENIIIIDLFFIRILIEL